MAASAGTLLSDLDSKSTAPEDAQFVQRILAEMNQPVGGSGGNQIAYPGGGQQMAPMAPIAPMATSGFMPGPNQVINSPNPNTMAPMAMDPTAATAHLIGKDAPTPGDFARMMYSGGAGAGGGGGGAGAAGPHYMPNQMQYPTAPQLNPIPQQQGWLTGLFKDFGGQLRLPLLVAIVIFIMSLPAINVLIAHYVPYLVMASGQMSTLGQVTKALAGGLLFWIVYKVIIPLGAGAI
jgi:hypothetical protein